MIPYIYYGVYDSGGTPYVISDNTGATFSGTSDTYARQLTPTSNFVAELNLAISAWDTGDVSTSLLRFDGITSVPTGNTVVSSKLKFYCSDDFGSSPTLNVYALRRTFVENQATWNIFQTGSNWGSGGALNSTTDYEPTLLGTASIGGIGIVEVTGSALNTYLQSILDGATHHGFLLVEANFLAPAGQNKAMSFTSSRGTDGERPELTIELVPSSGDEFAAITETLSAADGSSSVLVTSSSITETSAANHSQTVTFVTNSSISESSTGADSQDAVIVKLVSITETLSAVANETAQFIALVSVTETNTANHSQTAIATFNVAANESSTASHSQTATFITSSAITETNTGADSNDGAIVATTNVEITENSNAADTQTATQSTTATVSETSSATDSSATQNIINVAITETSNAIDSCVFILKLIKRVITGDVSIRELGSTLVKRFFNQSLVERDVDSSLTKRNVDSNLTEREP